MSEKKKEKVIAVRIGEELKEQLDDYCKDNKLNKSRLARNALFMYMRIYNREKIIQNPLLVWGKHELIHLLKFLPEEEIEKLADISFANSKEWARENKPKDGEFDVKSISLIMKDWIFSKEGQNWFSEIRDSWSNNNSLYTIAGRHNLGSNFSLYVKYFMEKQMNAYSYKLENEDLKEFQDDFMIKLDFRKNI